jgi:hypothetical protein
MDTSSDSSNNPESFEILESESAPTLNELAKTLGVDAEPSNQNVKEDCVPKVASQKKAINQTVDDIPREQVKLASTSKSKTNNLRGNNIIIYLLSRVMLLIWF